MMSWDIVGQERALATVSASLRDGNLSRSYLFVGTTGLGKRRLAIQLSQALNCMAEEPPCQKCNQCTRTASGLHADVKTVTTGKEERDTRSISIAQVREIERTVALQPFEGRVRTIIIDPADAMNVHAQSAFLKTLEEPPRNVFFILVTARPEALLGTIRSRCHEIQFNLLPLHQIEDALRQRFGLPQEKALSIARLAQGCIGRAISLATEEDALTERGRALEELRTLPWQSVRRRFQWAHELSSRFDDDHRTTLQTLELWQQWWRDILLVKSGADISIDNIDHRQMLLEEADHYSRDGIATFLHSIAVTVRQLGDNANPRLAIEAMMLAVPEPTKSDVGFR